MGTSAGVGGAFTAGFFSTGGGGGGLGERFPMGLSHSSSPLPPQGAANHLTCVTASSIVCWHSAQHLYPVCCSKLHSDCPAAAVRKMGSTFGGHTPEQRQTPSVPAGSCFQSFWHWHPRRLYASPT